MVTVSANRILQDNVIMEIFTWSPFTRMSVDPERYVYHKIQQCISHMAIHQYGFKLLEIEYLHDKIVYQYAYADKTPPNIMESQQFNYYPVLGERKCEVCRHRRIYKGTEYCLHKGTKLKRNAHYRCLEWSEIALRQGDSSCISRQKTKLR